MPFVLIFCFLLFVLQNLFVEPYVFIVFVLSSAWLCVFCSYSETAAPSDEEAPPRRTARELWQPASPSRSSSRDNWMLSCPPLTPQTLTSSGEIYFFFPGKNQESHKYRPTNMFFFGLPSFFRVLIGLRVFSGRLLRSEVGGRVGRRGGGRYVCNGVEYSSVAVACCIVCVQTWCFVVMSSQFCCRMGIRVYILRLWLLRADPGKLK